MRFWSHQSEFAGSHACQTCHPEIYARQRSSNHAVSLRRARDVPVLISAVPFSRRDRVSGFELKLSRGPDESIRISAENATATSGAALEWAFGSGVKGVTPIGRTDAGAWVESRLTWYASLGGIDFTTGASKYDPKDAVQSLGRGLSPEEVTQCFGCHTTGYDERSSTPAEDEMGITCERCHGPGLEHVRTAASMATFNPSALSGFAQAQVCGACHGRPPQDNEFDALALLERTPHSVRFPSQRIVLSRCFNESVGELACTTCHDPHGDVADEAHKFDSSCLSCHNRAARERASVCDVGTTGCSSCHMPKERVMRHSSFSDHWIRVVHLD